MKNQGLETGFCEFTISSILCYYRYVKNCDLKIVFTGDIGFDHYMDERWKDDDLLSIGVKKYLADADYVIGNLEGPVLNFDSDDRNKKDSIEHGMSEGVLKFLYDSNIKYLSLSNNHIMDKGRDGLVSTLQLADKNNIKTFGAGLDINEAKKPIYFNSVGDIGIFSICYSRGERVATKNKEGILNWNDYDTIQSVIDEIKSKCSFCVMIVHGGEEFTALPSPYTRDRYHKYLDMGVDVIVGHHPHVPMCYERVNTKIIFYSLGNFIFDTDYQRAQEHTDGGVLLKMVFTDDGFTFDTIGIKIDRKEDKILDCNSPNIFTEVNDDEYKLLLPLSVRKHFDAAKKQLKFLWPSEYNDDISDEWMRDHYFETKVGARKGELMDFTILYDELKRIEDNDYVKSNLKEVIEYINK